MYYTELGHLYVIIIFFFLITPLVFLEISIITTFAHCLVSYFSYQQLFPHLPIKAVKFLSIEIYQFITLKGQWEETFTWIPPSSFCLRNLNMCFSSMFYCYHLKSLTIIMGISFFSAQLVPLVFGHHFFFSFLVYSLVWFRHPSRNFPGQTHRSHLETLVFRMLLIFIFNLISNLNGTSNLEIISPQNLEKIAQRLFSFYFYS